MKKGLLKNLFLYSVSIIVILLIYLLLYVFPAMKSVSRMEIMTKDFQLKSRDLEKSGNSFIKPDKREEMLLRKVEREFEEYIPLINGSERQTRYIEEVKGKLERIFLGAGIDNSTFNVVGKDDYKGGSDHVFSPGTFIYGRQKVRSGGLIVSFKATFNELITLLNRLSSFRGPLLVNGLRGDKVKNVLSFRINFDIFFRVEGSSKKSSEAGKFVDVNSPLLLDRVYKNAVERVEK